MIKEAYILGNIGLAFYRLEEKWFVLDSRALDAPRECHSFDMNSALLSNSEVIHFQKEKPLGEIKKALRLETERQEALTTALQFIDSSIKRKNTKRLIAEYLSELIESPGILEFLENRLWSTPMPSVFMPFEGMTMAKELGFTRLAQFYQKLAKARKAISMFEVCWKKVVHQTPYLKDLENIEKIYHLLSDHGYIKQFIESVYHRDRKEWAAAVLATSLFLEQETLLEKTDFLQKIEEELLRTYHIVLLNKMDFVSKIADEIIIRQHRAKSQYSDKELFVAPDQMPLKINPGLLMFKRQTDNRTDEELLATYKRKPSSAILGLLFRRHQHKLYGLCFSYLKNPHDAEDALMDSFVSLPPKLLKYNIDDFESWLYLVVRDHCLKLLKEKARHNTDGLEVIHEEHFVESSSDETLNMGERRYEMLSNAINRLKDPQRKFIILFYLENLSYQEISELTSTPIKEIKAHIRNGRKNLKHVILKLM